MTTMAIDYLRKAIALIASVLFISVILYAGNLLLTQAAELEYLRTRTTFFQQQEQSIRSWSSALIQHSEKSANRLRNASVTEIDDRIIYLDDLLESKRTALRESESMVGMLNPSIQIATTKLKIEISVAVQERDFLVDVRTLVDGLPRLRQRCEQIQERIAKDQADLASIERQLNELTTTNRITSYIWRTDTYKKRKELEESRSKLEESNQSIRGEQGGCVKRLAEMEHDGAKLSALVINSTAIRDALQELSIEIEVLQEKLSRHFLYSFVVQPILEQLPWALGIVIASKLVPVLIKALMYFALVPIASRQPAIKLTENPTVTACPLTHSASAFSIDLHLDPTEELLVLPQHLQTHSAECTASSKMWLPGCKLVESYAAGMKGLTALKTDTGAQVNLSASQEALDELAVIDIGIDETLCLRPSHLVGIVHQTELPIQISRHWRLNSMQAWLTLQLRYMVFHGPMRLIVKGCKGVVVRNASEKSGIPQQLTMGFSAHLDYSTQRVETFWAYLSGKKGLLNDHFSGKNGIYIFEGIANPKKRSGLTGKGLEGVFDAVLKIFGI